MATIIDLDHGAEISEALQCLEDRLPSYEKYLNYFNGKHELRYVTENFREKFGSVFAKFADNICRRVVNTPKARTLFETIEGADSADDWFRKRRLDGFQRMIHRDAFLFGDAYAILWDRGDGPIPTRQKPSNIAPVYDPDEPGKLLCAAKVWIQSVGKTRLMRLTIYYEDRCERFSAGKVESISALIKRELEPYSSDGGDEIQTHEFGRVPLFHFPNQAGPGEFGTSELADVIPLQDALNKSCFDMLVNGEATCYAQRYATGIETKIVDGKPVNPFENKTLWTTASKEAGFGQLEAGDSEKLLAVVQSWRIEIGFVSGIPIYYLQTDASVPSGTALQVIEAPLRDKVTECQVIFGNIWEDLFAAALSVEVEKLTAVWKDTAPISEGEILDNGIKRKAIGFSEVAVMKILGLSEEEAKAVQAEKSAEEDAKVERAQRSISRDPMI